MKLLYVPLITPFYRGNIDEKSLRKLVNSLESHVDAFVPCLSSGEGNKLTLKQWELVAKTVVSASKKKVYVGILHPDKKFIKSAKKIDCAGIVVPTQSRNNVEFFKNLSKEFKKDIIVYNTEDNPIRSVDKILELDKLPNVIAIKDSSMNAGLFKKLISLRTSKHLRMYVFQGMEHKLLDSKNCDGFLISLANVEPQLCRAMLEAPTPNKNDKITKLFWEYNLGGTWFVTLKTILYQRKLIASAEEANMEIVPK